jgi:hypothetical protein
LLFQYAGLQVAYPKDKNNMLGQIDEQEKQAVSNITCGYRYQCSRTPFNRLPTAMLNPGATRQARGSAAPSNFFFLCKLFLSIQFMLTGPNLVLIAI